MSPTEAQIRATVEALCGSASTGRRPGSRAGEAARTFLVEAFRQAGLAAGGDDGYLQSIPDIGGANILGRIEGHGPHAARSILVVAHYDVCVSDEDPSAYRGADDNAAAVAIVLACATRLARRPHDLDRSVLVCAFDAEEPPYFMTPDMGSQFFVDHPTVPLETVDMMVCLDLVGHAVGGDVVPPAVRESVFVLGAELSEGTAAIVSRVEPTPGVRVRRLDNYLIPPLSDYDAFARRGIPFLFYTCGRWAHYHRPSDTPEKLDYVKQAALTDHLTELLLALSRRPEAAVRFVDEGYDDQATLETLVEVAGSLAPYDPRLRATLDQLVDLREMVGRGAGLGSQERHRLAALVMRMEQALG